MLPTFTSFQITVRPRTFRPHALQTQNKFKQIAYLTQNQESFENMLVQSTSTARTIAFIIKLRMALPSVVSLAPRAGMIIDVDVL